MYKFTGDWEILKEKGFIQDVYQSFWFIPKMSRGHVLIVNCKNRLVECACEDDLDIIRDSVKVVSWNECKQSIK